MIHLTRLNGTPLLVNSDLIKTVESSPDTMLTLLTGEKLIVGEDCDEVMKRILDWRASLLAQVAQCLDSNAGLGRVASMASLRLDANGNAEPLQNSDRHVSTASRNTHD